MRVLEKSANIFGKVVHRWRWWHAFVAVVAITLLSWGGFWWVQSSALERRYAEMRAAGYLVTLEELNDYCALPPGVEDNTDLWLKAIRLVTATPRNVKLTTSLPIVGDGPEIPPVGQPWAEHDLVVTYLDDYAEALTALHDAADAGGGVRYPHDMRKGISLLLPEVQALRQCARLLCLEAHVRAHNGDLSGAADSLRALLAVGKTLEREPILVSFLVHIAVDAFAVEQTRRLLDTAEFADDDLRAIQADLRSVDYVADLHHAMVSEQAFGLNCYNDLTVFGFSPAVAHLSKFVAPGAKMRHLDLMAKAIAETKKPWHEVFLSGSLTATTELNTKNPFDRLVAQVMPTVYIYFVAGANQVARTTSLDVAIAAELYRREQGKLPGKLNDLVPRYLPAVPVDPFDGNPLRYIVQGDDFVVYSVGEDLTDDGGDVDLGKANPPPDNGIRSGTTKPVTESPKVE